MDIEPIDIPSAVAVDSETLPLMTPPTAESPAAPPSVVTKPLAAPNIIPPTISQVKSQPLSPSTYALTPAVIPPINAPTIPPIIKTEMLIAKSPVGSTCITGLLLQYANKFKQVIF